MILFLYNIQFLGAVTCLALGFFVFMQSRHEVHRLMFLLLCILLFVVFISAIAGYSSGSKEGIILWSQIGSFAVNLFYAANLHFYLLLLKRKIPWWIIPLLYLPSIVIIVAYALDPLSIINFVSYDGEWKLMPNYGSTWFYSATGSVILYVIASVIVILFMATNAVSNKEKRQAKFLIANLSLSIVIGIFGLWVIPYFNYRIPNLAAAYHAVYVFGLFVSVFYYRFLEFKPSIVAEEIIANIGDMVILLNPDGNVTAGNAAFWQTIGCDQDKYLGLPLWRFVHDNDDVGADIQRMKSGETRKLQRPIRYRVRGNERVGYINTDSYLSRVTDRFNDLLGFLVISVIRGGRSQFQAHYGISDRELEIVDLMLSGLSSSEIGARLGISPRTVQTHQEHVYQKVGAAGKMELVRLAHRFNL